MNRKNRNLHPVVMAALVFALAAFCVDSRAGGGSANFTVSITVVDNCNVSALQSSGGSGASSGSATSDGGNIAVSCTKGTPAMITLGDGLHNIAASSMATSLQQMADRSSPASTRRSIRAAGADDVQARMGTLVATVNGAVEASQHVPAYADTVVATVTF